MHLVRICLIVKQKFLSIGFENSISILLRPVGPPFISVSKHSGRSGAHHQRALLCIRFSLDTAAVIASLRLRRHRQSHQGQKARHNINGIEHKIPSAAFLQMSLPFHKERHTYRFFIKNILGPSAMGSEKLSMVGGEHYD